MKYLIVTGTVTYAMRGRDYLRQRGIRAAVERTVSGGTDGCGYGLVVNGDISKIKKLLLDAGVKIRRTEELTDR